MRSCSSKLWIVRLLCITLLACAIAGCSSSQHASGDTKFTKQGDHIAVEVKLDEYKIHMPTTIPAGHVTLQVRNTGSHEHNIRIAGNGIDATLPHNLKQGDAAELTLDLKPGTYNVECPVGPHAALGMRLTLTVTP